MDGARVIAKIRWISIRYVDDYHDDDDDDEHDDKVDDHDDDQVDDDHERVPLPKYDG